MKFINILHITDLHFGINSDYDKASDQKDSALSLDFSERFSNDWVDVFQESIMVNWINQGRKIDYICFTGDLLQAGKITSEERIKRMDEGFLFLVNLCTKIGLEKSQILIVPGNHDVERQSGGLGLKTFEDLCTKYGIKNFATENILEVKASDGIKILGVNSCIGATEKIKEFNKDYFLKQIESSSINDIIKGIKEGSDYEYQKDLDIPAIGDGQHNEIIKKISSTNIIDCCILLMHHNPIPTNCIEIRPYANLIDGGRFLNDLLKTNKKVFILHGHTHFDSCITSHLPQVEKNNFVSVIGGAALNAKGKASILEFIFSDDDIHLKTNVHQLSRDGASFKVAPIYEISNILEALSYYISYGNLKTYKKYSFEDIKKALKYDDSDEDLISSIMFLCPHVITITQNGNSDYKKWKFTRIR